MTDEIDDTDDGDSAKENNETSDYQSAKQQIDKEIPTSIDNAPRVLQIPFEFVTRHDKKTVKLLANSGESESFKGKSIWFNYQFSEPCFLEIIVINEKQYSSFNEFDLSATLLDGSKLTQRVSPDNDRVIWRVENFVTEISFRPPRNWRSGGAIEDVTIYGFAQSQAAAFELFADKLHETRETVLNDINRRKEVITNKLVELKRLAGTKNRLNAEISEREGCLKELENSLKAVSDRRDEAVVRLEGVKQSINENDQKILDQVNRIGEVSDVRSKLARSIIKKEQRLKSLIANINLFPSELSDFVSQGARDVRLYFILAAVPIILIAAMFGILVDGAADLTTRITGEESVNILAIIVSRAPFVIVSVTVITASYYLARMFILEMVRVNRQKLSLSKIGIIAKDISYSVEHELDLSDEEKYARRLRLKMDMLRDHLKDYLSKDFEPSLPKRSPFEQFELPKIGSTELESTEMKDIDEYQADDADGGERE